MSLDIRRGGKLNQAPCFLRQIVLTRCSRQVTRLERANSRRDTQFEGTEFIDTSRCFRLVLEEKLSCDPLLESWRTSQHATPPWQASCTPSHDKTPEQRLPSTLKLQSPYPSQNKQTNNLITANMRFFKSIATLSTFLVFVSAVAVEHKGKLPPPRQRSSTANTTGPASSLTVITSTDAKASRPIAGMFVLVDSSVFEVYLTSYSCKLLGRQGWLWCWRRGWLHCLLHCHWADLNLLCQR